MLHQINFLYTKNFDKLYNKTKINVTRKKGIFLTSTFINFKHLYIYILLSYNSVVAHV